MHNTEVQNPEFQFHAWHRGVEPRVDSFSPATPFSIIHGSDSPHPKLSLRHRHRHRLPPLCFSWRRHTVTMGGGGGRAFLSLSLSCAAVTPLPVRSTCAAHRARKRVHVEEILRPQSRCWGWGEKKGTLDTTLNPDDTSPAAMHPPQHPATSGLVKKPIHRRRWLEETGEPACLAFLSTQRTHYHDVNMASWMDAA